ncbi:RNA polymerase sigma factor [candidate division KSB1 bacterium]
MVGLSLNNGRSEDPGEMLEDRGNELVRRVKRGDLSAFDKLVALYQQRLYYTVIRIVLHHEDANDVVQDTFIKAFRNLDTFKEEYRFYTWLYRIAVNTALNHIHHRRYKEDSLEGMYEEKRFDPKTKQDVEEETVQSEMLLRVRKALASIPPDMRSVLTLRVYDDLSYQEIADILEISIGTVMSRLHRARNLLREQMVKSGWFEDNNK